ncbi:aldehyde dehydrogenase family protein [Pseudomonas sp. NPDC008258]|uniref:aldehyde dehydrogenase family protein n=1 Tax=Pseudomonas sp. NPDC008258 TaxID=3364418 RepID=UPI0036E459EF
MPAKNLDAHLFINGQWQEGSAGKRDNVDPGNGEILGIVSLASASQVDAAIKAADAAFPAWSRTPAVHRGLLLKKVSALLAERVDELANALLLEGGKTKADAYGEAGRAIEAFGWNGEEASRVFGKVHTGIVEGSTRLSVPTALGVAVAITPWNFPAVLIARKLGAALAAGCTAVLKASEFTPYSATVIIRAIVDAGIPAGVVNLVYGDPAAVSEQLLAAPEVKIVSFTGSTHVGKLLAAQAARNLTRCVFELGGHAPVIVWEDADPERVIQVTAPAKFGTAGQSCVAPTRYLVHESLHDKIVQGLVAKAESYQLGHGLEDGTTLGPVAHAGRIAEFKALIEDAVSKGAVVETGGYQVDRPGFFFKPTILSNVPSDAKILFEEPFGPIATVQKVASLEQALEHANAAPYAFAAYLFSDSLRVRNEVVAKLNASNLGINQTAPSLPDVALGGLGNSGYGYEGGSEGVLAYTQLKLINQSAL